MTDDEVRADELEPLDELPVQRVEVLPEPGYPVTVVIIAQGEDELAALDGVVLAHGVWLDIMDKANQLGPADEHAHARDAREKDDTAVVVEWARRQHEVAGGAGTSDEEREARKDEARAAMRDRG